MTRKPIRTDTLAETQRKRYFKGQKLLARYVMDCSIRLFHFHTWPPPTENHQRTNAKPSHSVAFSFYPSPAASV